MNINIRLATLGDAMICADIHTRSWSFTYDGVVPKDIIDAYNTRWPIIWRKMLANNTNSHYVIICDSTIIGFFTISVSRDEDLKDYSYEIVGMYLDPNYVGLGYGKQTMDWIKAEIKNRGYHIISLWVLEENNRARAFYEKSGFSVDGKMKPSGLADTCEVRYVL